MLAEIPQLIYTGILVQCHRLRLSPFLLLGLYMRESSLHWDAKGDYGPGDPGRFPSDPFWTPDKKGLYPHSFGLGQLHVDGAGSPHPPAYLLDITNNIRISAEYLRDCLDATGERWADAVSAYNQGIGGWQRLGRRINQGYVDDVLGYYELFTQAEITVVADVGGDWKTEVII